MALAANTYSVPTEPGAGPRSVQTVLSVRSCDCGILGPENLILGLAEGLESCSVRHVIANLWDGTPATVELHEEAVRRGLESEVVRTSFGWDPALFSRLAATIRRYKTDIVLTHDVKSEVAALVATRFAPAPLVGFFYGRLAMRSPWLKLEEMGGFIGFQFFNRVLANSAAQRDELLRWHIKARQVDVVPSFVRTDSLRPPSAEEAQAARRALDIELDRPVLATVARLSPNKGHEFTLQAVAQIREQAPNLLYLISGEGDVTWHGEGGFREHLVRQASSLGISDAVRFLGYYPDVRTVLHAADIVVSASLREGMQVSLIEAMAAGRPVVATAIGGTPDAVVDGETGLLVPPAEPRAIAAAVLKLLHDNALMRRMGEAARRRAEEHFDARVVARNLLAILEKAKPGG